ncbi:MAG TPA: Ig-like domain-containing protein, partial [Candidatus Acidoferrum sp.]|nr:Ig-like domain-containing protein [Candidatus Acidoferrum sp.]
MKTAFILLAIFASHAFAATTLVPLGATWRFIDNGSYPGASWAARSFNDASWRSGPAQLGYGDGDEATVVGFGPNASAKYIATYFRRSFVVANPAAFSQLTCRVKRDDGVIIFLNGTEVFRNNMPAGAASATTLASAAIGGADENAFLSANISAGLLVAGTNVVAAEIHQSSRSSTDVSFDLELIGTDTSVIVTRGPYLQVATPNSIIIRWRTGTATDSVVRFGTSLTALSSIASDAASTTEHSVRLTGLTPDTLYYYSIGTSAAELTKGAGHSFYTPPPVGSSFPTRIWALGDAGTGTSSQFAVRDAYYAAAGSNYTDVCLMLGDNVYETGTDQEFQTRLFDVYAAFLRRTPAWPTIGNHDTAGSQNPSLTIPYFQSFTLPTQGEAGGVASGTERYYSFDFGEIHFVCLDSQTSSRTPGSPMLTWLQNDLANTVSRWVIAYWHHPAYSKGHNSDTDTQSTEMRRNVVPILEAYGVDLVLAGHTHAYERSYLVDHHYGTSSTLTSDMILDAGDGRENGNGAYLKSSPGQAANQGAVYVVAGSSGKVQSYPLNHPVMFTSFARLGSLVIDVNGNRMDVRFLRETGGIDDYFTIVKGTSGNVSPTVQITSPTQGAAFNAPAQITLTANAGDQDGTINEVVYYAGSTRIGSATAPPYALIWNNVAAGSYQIVANAIDNLSASTPSSPINITVTNAAAPPSSGTFISTGSVWKYLDTGVNAGTAWRGISFDDSAWRSGPAQLGYGDGDERTVVSYGPNSSSKFLTTYFRRAFTVTGALAFTGLSLSTLRDDGAVVYLNGTEVYRGNMPTGTVTSGTRASSDVTGSGES